MIFVTAAITAIKGLAAMKFLAPVLSITANFIPILGYIRKFWREALIVALLAGILGTVWWKNRVITKLDFSIATLERSLVTVDTVLNENYRAITECVAINRANQRAYEAELLAAERAVSRARIANQVAEAEVESINEDVTELRGQDEDCRSLDEPLPDWFDDWLRSD